MKLLVNSVAFLTAAAIVVTMSSCGAKKVNNKSDITDEGSSPAQTVSTPSSPASAPETAEFHGNAAETVSDDSGQQYSTQESEQSFAVDEQETEEQNHGQTVLPSPNEDPSAGNHSAEAEPESSETTVSEPDPAYLFMWSDDFLTASMHMRLQSKFLKLINEERSSKGLCELTEDSDLDRITAFRGYEVQTAFSHTRPDGTPWYTAIPKSYPEKSSGENLTYTAVKTNDPSPISLSEEALDEIAERAFNNFKDSPPHYENIMREEFTRIGICFNIVKKTEGDIFYYYYYCTNIFASLK